MNVRVLGKDDEAKAPQAPPPAPRAVDDFDDTDPVSVGDRLRRVLAGGGEKEPLYPRILRLRNVAPNGWQRALLLEGMALTGALVALADRATAWAPVVLPAGAAVLVKFHDILAGLLPSRAGNDSAAPPGTGNAAGADDR